MLPGRTRPREHCGLDLPLTGLFGAKAGKACLCERASLSLKKGLELPRTPVCCGKKLGTANRWLGMADGESCERATGAVKSMGKPTQDG